VVGEELTLKVGALVMVRVNNEALEVVNGTMGVITSIKAGFIEIETTDDKRRVQLGKHTWKVCDADGEVVATATNYPITLSWAGPPILDPSISKSRS
jgi:ATP-dependent exoDNAse (exonuclease V) alpha subunit